MKQRSWTAAVMAAIVVVGIANVAGTAETQPPKGFTKLFNGKDLTGWRGRQPNYNPAEEAKLSKSELAAKQAEWNTARDLHWKVDTAKGEIVSDGQSPHLATGKDYGDFEFHVEWLMVSHNGDSGVYLRGYPQVQVWDPDNPREVKKRRRRKARVRCGTTIPRTRGSGRWSKPTTRSGSGMPSRIRMVGSRVWVWLNDKADGRGPGARQLLRSRPAGRGARSDRVADARIGDPVQEHLCARDFRDRSKIHRRSGGTLNRIARLKFCGASGRSWRRARADDEAVGQRHRRRARRLPVAECPAAGARCLRQSAASAARWSSAAGPCAREPDVVEPDDREVLGHAQAVAARGARARRSPFRR